MAEPELQGIARLLGDLDPKAKEPASRRILDGWVNKAQSDLGVTSGRLGWLIATTVVAAALQRAVDDDGRSSFLLKGGTMLQYRLPGMSRATQDLDGLVRGDLDAFIDAVDRVFREPWGPLQLVRGPVEVIDVPHKLVKPRRFAVLVQHKGQTWRRVPVEVSPDEGSAGARPDVLPAPSLAGFGLPSPDHLVSLSLAYQIAQKVHACTDPHDPPASVNDRARDVVDLLLLRDLVTSQGAPLELEISAAIRDVFDARAAEARAAGGDARGLPVTITAHPHWKASYAAAATSAGVSSPLEVAVSEVDSWLQSLLGSS